MLTHFGNEKNTLGGDKIKTIGTQNMDRMPRVGQPWSKVSADTLLYTFYIAWHTHYIVHCTY